MAFLKALWQFIQVVPVLVSLFNQAMAKYEEYKKRKAKEASDKANEQLEKAKTPEEIWKANEEITRNLP